MRTDIHKYRHAHIPTNACTCIHNHMQTHTHRHTQMQTFEYKYARTHTGTHACMHAYRHTMYAIHTHTHIDTYTHTRLCIRRPVLPSRLTRKCDGINTARKTRTPSTSPPRLNGGVDHDIQQLKGLLCIFCLVLGYSIATVVLRIQSRWTTDCHRPSTFNAAKNPWKLAASETT